MGHREMRKEMTHMMMQMRGTMSGLVALAAAALLLVGGAARAYEVVEVSDGGSISGRVTFSGPVPEAGSLDVTKNQDQCGAKVPVESLLVGKDGGVRNAVITIEGIEAGKDFDKTEHVLDNRSCRFVPHVQVVPVKQKLKIINSDPILHNTHAFLGTATVFNLALPLQNQTIPKRMKRPGVLSVKCDAGHTWMSAWVVVAENPYYAVTDETGAFEITDIPPGTWQVKAWHETLGTEVQEIVVQGGQTASVTFAGLSR
jgi:hypothetical protein